LNLLFDQRPACLVDFRKPLCLHRFQFLEILTQGVGLLSEPNMRVVAERAIEIEQSAFHCFEELHNGHDSILASEWRGDNANANHAGEQDIQYVVRSTGRVIAAKEKKVAGDAAAKDLFASTRRSEYFRQLACQPCRVRQVFADAPIRAERRCRLAVRLRRLDPPYARSHRQEHE
jgi:hypothetical protein